MNNLETDTDRAPNGIELRNSTEKRHVAVVVDVNVEDDVGTAADAVTGCAEAEQAVHALRFFPLSVRFCTARLYKRVKI